MNVYRIILSDYITGEVVWVDNVIAENQKEALQQIPRLGDYINSEKIDLKLIVNFLKKNEN